MHSTTRSPAAAAFPGVVLVYWLIVLCSLCSGSSLAAPVLQLAETRLPTPVNGDGASGDNFGIAVAVFGSTAVVGAYGDTVAVPGAPFGVAQGSAYVFQRGASAWTQTQKLLPGPIGEDGDNYGVAVAMVDDVLVVAAPRRSANGVAEAGSVFIYGLAPQGYLLRQLLLPPQFTAGQRFGSSIAVWQDQLAIGVPQDGGGRVDLYQRDSAGRYQFQRSLSAEASAAQGQFGAALAFADAQLLIGAPTVDGSGAVYRSVLDGGLWSDALRLPLGATNGAELGAALVMDSDLALVGAPGAGAGEVRVLGLEVTGWQQLTRLTPAVGASGDRFGSALALDAQRAVVGAVLALSGEGASTVYSRDGRVLTAQSELNIADGGNGKRFGAAVALTVDGVLIGADLDRVGPNRGQGSVRWYRDTGGGMQSAGRLDNGDGAMFDRYGTAVAVDGDIAMVGAYVEDTQAGADAGRVHWFERVNGKWTRRGALDAPDANVEDRFGIAVDVAGDYAAVGAFWDIVGNNVDQGSVYIFHRQGASWQFQAKLVASDGRPRDLFGFALALDGDRVLIGARGAAVPFLDQGKAYVFVRNGSSWVEEAQLSLPQPSGTAYFGASVALAKDRALIGAPGVSSAPGPANAGAAYVFERKGSSWLPTATLQAPIMRSNAAFGFAVAADANYLLVGAFQDEPAGRGAAYVYRATDKVLDGQLVASAGQAGEGLGISVAIQGNTAVLGAAGFDLKDDLSVGTVRVFERDQQTWRESAQLLSLDGTFGDAFGRAVATDGRHIVIGAPAKGVDNPLEGAAYVLPVDAVFADRFE